MCNNILDGSVVLHTLFIRLSTLREKLVMCHVSCKQEFRSVCALYGVWYLLRLYSVDCVANPLYVKSRST